MPIRFYDNKYQGETVQTNANQVLTNISNMIRKIKDEADNISEKVAREVVSEAQSRLLDSGYDVGEYVNNIDWKKDSGKDYYTVGFKDDKDVMYYLEYGTGFVGEANPHPEADVRKWRYAINRDETFDDGKPLYFDMTKPRGQQGLFSIDAPTPKKNTRGWLFRDEDGQLIATSGLRAVAYMYNTYQNAGNIKSRAIKESKIKSIIKGGR